MGLVDPITAGASVLGGLFNWIGGNKKAKEQDKYNAAVVNDATRLTNENNDWQTGVDNQSAVRDENARTPVANLRTSLLKALTMGGGKYRIEGLDANAVPAYERNAAYNPMRYAPKPRAVAITPPKTSTGAVWQGIGNALTGAAQGRVANQQGEDFMSQLEMLLKAAHPDTLPTGGISPSAARDLTGVKALNSPNKNYYSAILNAFNRRG